VTFIKLHIAVYLLSRGRRSVDSTPVSPNLVPLGTIDKQRSVGADL